MSRPAQSVLDAALSAIEGVLQTHAAVPADMRHRFGSVANQALKTSLNLILGTHYDPFVQAVMQYCSSFQRDPFAVGSTLTLEMARQAFALAFPTVIDDAA